MVSEAGAVARAVIPSKRRHASEAEYKDWVNAFVPNQDAGYERLAAYRRFVRAWPDLEEWFDAPLLVRAGFTGAPLRATGRTGTFSASGYLVYLALVHGIGLDHDFLFVRKYARLFSVEAGGRGLGVDLDLLDARAARLTELGYNPVSSRSNLTWSIGRLVLSRGDPDITTIDAEDLFDLAERIRAFGQREDFAQLRAALYRKSPWQMTGEGAGERFIRAHLAKIHSLHVLLFNVGQVTEAPLTGTIRRAGWEQNLLPEPCPPLIRAVIERYLNIRLEAQFDRPQTVRLAREGLRRLVNWLGMEHPELTSLAQLDRALVEDYLRWLPTCISQTTGQPLTATTRKHEINAIEAFCRETGIWDWPEVPGSSVIGPFCAGVPPS